MHNTIETIDLSDFYAKTDNAETRAYEHALDLSYLVVEEMEKRGLTKSELARCMKVSPSRLAKRLNTQPNMTLKTIAQFEIALGIKIAFEASPSIVGSCPYTQHTAGNTWNKVGRSTPVVAVSTSTPQSKDGFGETSWAPLAA